MKKQKQKVSGEYTPVCAYNSNYTQIAITIMDMSRESKKSQTQQPDIHNQKKYSTTAPVAFITKDHHPGLPICQIIKVITTNLTKWKE